MDSVTLPSTRGRMLPFAVVIVPVVLLTHQRKILPAIAVAGTIYGSPWATTTFPLTNLNLKSPRFN